MPSPDGLVNQVRAAWPSLDASKRSQWASLWAGMRISNPAAVHVVARQPWRLCSHRASARCRAPRAVQLRHCGPRLLTSRHIPQASRRSARHPSCRVFQRLRGGDGRPCGLGAAPHRSPTLTRFVHLMPFPASAHPCMCAVAASTARLSLPPKPLYPRPATPDPRLAATTSGPGSAAPPSGAASSASGPKPSLFASALGALSSSLSGSSNSSPGASPAPPHAASAGAGPLGPGPTEPAQDSAPQSVVSPRSRGAGEQSADPHQRRCPHTTCNSHDHAAAPDLARLRAHAACASHGFTRPRAQPRPYQTTSAVLARVSFPLSQVGVWPGFSRLNHACAPNAVHYTVRGTMLVRAVQVSAWLRAPMPRLLCLATSPAEPRGRGQPRLFLT